MSSASKLSFAVINCAMIVLLCGYVGMCDTQPNNKSPR